MRRSNRKNPQEIKNIFQNNLCSFEKNEIVGFTEDYTDGDSEYLAGIYKFDKLDTHRFDDNGFSTVVHENHDISTWDISQDLDKISKWDNLIHGVMNSTFPQNYGWTTKFSKGEIHHLSELKTNKLTTMETQFQTKLPNCLFNWLKKGVKFLVKT